MKALILSLLVPTMVFAQSPGSADGPQPTFPTVPPPGADGSMREKVREQIRDRVAEQMPPELRKRFEAARLKAMQDPALQALKNKADAANEEFRDAMRAAMLKADPELGEILKSVAGKMKGKGAHGGPPGLGALSEADRQRLTAARERAKEDPSVVAAAEKRKNATTPSERAAADKEFHQAMRAALLKVDPSLGPVLDQLEPDRRGPKGPGKSSGEADPAIPSAT